MDTSQDFSDNSLIALKWGERQHVLQWRTNNPQKRFCLYHTWDFNEVHRLHTKNNYSYTCKTPQPVALVEQRVLVFRKREREGRKKNSFPQVTVNYCQQCLMYCIEVLLCSLRFFKTWRFYTQLSHRQREYCIKAFFSYSLLDHLKKIST